MIGGEEPGEAGKGEGHDLTPEEGKEQQEEMESQAAGESGPES